MTYAGWKGCSTSDNVIRINGFEAEIQMHTLVVAWFDGSAYCCHEHVGLRQQLLQLCNALSRTVSVASSG